MDIITLIGQVGDKGMAPQENTYNGKPFRRCGMWVDDPFGEPVYDENGEKVVQANGRDQLKRKSYQVIFPSDDDGGKLFKSIRPGRRLCVIGRVSYRERVAEHNGKPTRKEILTDPSSNKKYEAWANPSVHVMRVEFLDPPVKSTFERYLDVAVQAEFITEEYKHELSEVVLSNIGNRDASQGDADREQPDRGASDAGEEVPTEDGDEDKPF